MSSFNIPEPMTEPPDDGVYITADCGHEVYAGETYVYWKNARADTVTLCPDCFWDRVRELTIQEAALLLGCDYSTVEKVK
jgi:hypothetical protein